MVAIVKSAQLKSVISVLLITSMFIAAVFAINESLNETNSSLVLNLSPDLNLTPDVNISVNISVDVNQTPNTSSTKEDKDVIKDNKNKLNKKTEDYLKNNNDKKEKKEYLVKFKDSVNDEVLTDVKLKDSYELFKTAKIESSLEDIELILDNPEVEYLELDQNTELLSEQVPYNIEKTNAPLAWNLTKGDGVKVAVLDTGISSHPDLSISGGTSVVSDNFNDNNGHGTAVAGVISALLNDDGLVGISPASSIYAVKIMEDSQGQLSDAIEGVEWAIDNNMGIITMSFGMESYSQIFKDVLEDAYDNGILLVAAAGNNNENILYPAAYDDVIAVGAVDEDNERASFSSYGIELELVADGVNVNSTALDNRYELRSGTSMSAPHVAGIATLIKAYNSSLSNTQIRVKLQNDALDLGEEGKDDYYGYGLAQVNMESYNYTVTNESYFYEIFNISYFGTENQEFLFWLYGIGTVDDVTFSEGYYLVNITIENIVRSYIYNVSENGTIFVLSATISLGDNYSYEYSSTSDGFTWVNGLLQVSMTVEEGPMSNVHAECYKNATSETYYEFCYFRSSQIQTDCDATKGAINCNSPGHTKCYVENPGDFHTLSTSAIHQKTLYGAYWYNSADCSAGDGYYQNTVTYRIINKKRFVCQNTTLAAFQGYSGSWQQYSTEQCYGGSVCDTTRDYDEFTTPSPNLDVCVAPCSGIIEVNVLDSDSNPLNGSHIYLNGVYRNTTDSQGQKILGGSSCNMYNNVSVYCADNQTRLCETKQVDVPSDGSKPAVIFDCNLCSNEANLKISLGDVDIDDNQNILVNVHTENINAPNGVNVTVKGQNENDGLISVESSGLTPAISSSTRNVTKSISLNLANIDYIHVYIDPVGAIAESKDDNYVLRPFVKDKIKAYLDINTGNSKVDEAVREYLEIFVHPQSIPGSVSIIAIGRYTNYTKEGTDHNNFQLDVNNRGLRSNQIIYDGKALGNLPYIGLINTGHYLGSDYIFAYGKQIEGDIAVVKKLISHRDVFFSESLKGESSTDVSQEANVIDKYDVSGIAVYDLLHNNETEQYFLKKSGFEGERFKQIVLDVLNDNNYEISIKTVKTYNDNTTLRLKNVNSDFSNDFQDAVVGTSKPVVLARGLWSNLLTWDVFGKELSFDEDNARDTWLIEITGGPTTECDTCPNYYYEDLTDYYWPALIAGVEYYSGQNQIDYVGFSNGCRVALDSLKNWSSSGKINAGYCFNTVTGFYDIGCNLSSTPVDTFIGVGCPGAFNGSSLFGDCLNQSGEWALNYFEENNIHHITQKQLTQRLAISPANNLNCVLLAPFLVSDGKISRNIGEYYFTLIKSNQDPQPAKGLNLNRFSIIYGTDGFGLNNDNDYIVTENDELAIFNNINSGNKELISFHLIHNQLPRDENVQNSIEGGLQ